jgi:hypothetical protein
MPRLEELRSQWKAFIRFLDAMASAADFDPHEEQRRRVSEIEKRLSSIEQRSPLVNLPRNSAAPDG